MKLYIIGYGMGNENSLSIEARDIIKNCPIVIGSERFSLSFRDDIIKLSYNDIPDFIKNNKDDICLLVSGDTNYFSISNSIYSSFKGEREVITIPSVSSMQYFASKLNIKYHNWVSISLHGRDNLSLINKLCYKEYVFVLTGGKNKVRDILDYVHSFGINSTIYIGENLSYKNEKITKGTIKEFLNYDFSELSVILFENDIAHTKPLFDKDFIRGNVPMTKEVIRWASVNYLNLDENDIVFDIGSGTGSVSLEMASKCSLVISFEHNKEAINLLYENKNKFKRHNIKVIEESYPTNCEYIPNKAFIGGSNGKIDEIIKHLAGLNPDIEIATNIISLDNLTKVINVFRELDFNYDVSLLNISQNKKIGSSDILSANNGVYIIRGSKND